MLQLEPFQCSARVSRVVDPTAQTSLVEIAATPRSSLLCPIFAPGTTLQLPQVDELMVFAAGLDDVPAAWVVNRVELSNVKASTHTRGKEKAKTSFRRREERITESHFQSALFVRCCYQERIRETPLKDVLRGTGIHLLSARVHISLSDKYKCL